MNAKFVSHLRGGTSKSAGLRFPPWASRGRGLIRGPQSAYRAGAGTLAFLWRVAGLVGAIEGLGEALADSAREWAIYFSRILTDRAIQYLYYT